MKTHQSRRRPCCALPSPDYTPAPRPLLRGSYLGLIERIPHLKELGINAVELLPIYEYDELEFARLPNPRQHLVRGAGGSREGERERDRTRRDRVAGGTRAACLCMCALRESAWARYRGSENLTCQPLAGETLQLCTGPRLQRTPPRRPPQINAWGYSTMSFFAPMSRFGTGKGAAAAARELKTMVRELHRNGIEVYLDVVYNHTCEGDDTEPYTTSFRAIDNQEYYMLERASGKANFFNYSGCGNTFNANNGAAKRLVLDSLRHWRARGRRGPRLFASASPTRGCSC